MSLKLNKNIYKKQMEPVVFFIIHKRIFQF